MMDMWVNIARDRDIQESPGWTWPEPGVCVFEDSREPHCSQETQRYKGNQNGGL